MPINEPGYLLYEGSSPFNGEPIVAVMTMRSMNIKTGDMCQLWILPANTAPTDAVRNGDDKAVCGDCVMRAKDDGKGRACYVVMHQGPLSVWLKYRRGGYVDARLLGLSDVAALFADAYVRLGAWGDPAMLPFRLVNATVSQAAGWTGYTHQWPTISRSWADILMASVERESERRAARSMGYRCFFVVPEGADPSTIPGAMECAFTRKDKRKLQCRECLACSGTRNGTVHGAVDVAIEAHGNGRKYV